MRKHKKDGFFMWHALISVTFIVLILQSTLTMVRHSATLQRHILSLSRQMNNTQETRHTVVSAVPFACGHASGELVGIPFSYIQKSLLGQLVYAGM